MIQSMAITENIMTDITKCKGEQCSIKDTCYRYTAPSESRYQSYAAFDELYKDKNSGPCEYYCHSDVTQLTLAKKIMTTSTNYKKDSAQFLEYLKANTSVFIRLLPDTTYQICVVDNPDFVINTFSSLKKAQKYCNRVGLTVQEV